MVILFENNHSFFHFIADLEMAIAYWNIVFKGRFKFLDMWVQFLTVNIKIKCF